MDPLTILIIAALLATCAALGIGIMTMASGGYNDRDFGEPLMWTRVGLQALTLVLLGAAILLR